MCVCVCVCEMKNRWKSGYTKVQIADSVQNIQFFLY